jgi:hypothetical protein
MSEKITTVNVHVPVKSSGGVIHQRQVAFDVLKEESHFSLIPCLSEDERRVANLPESLNFKMENGKPVSLRGKMDGNFHVIQDAVGLLQKEQQLA